MNRAAAPKTGGGTRRQALNACDACRQRKTKCDESKPTCNRCKRLGLTCRYIETSASKKTLALTEYTATLERLEEKIDSLADSITGQGGRSNARQPQGHPCDLALLQQEAEGCFICSRCAAESRGSYNVCNLLDATPAKRRSDLALKQHSTAAQNILLWPCSPLKLTDTDLQYPITLEIKREKLLKTIGNTDVSTFGSSTHWFKNISHSHLHSLISCYFAHFHPQCLVLEESTFYAHHLRYALEGDFEEGIDSCLVLLVLALGAVAAYEAETHEHGPLSNMQLGDVGLGLFRMALKRFREEEATDWTSVQCLLLMGFYYSAKLRLHDQWRAISRACSTLMILLPLEDSLGPLHCQLYWIAYLQESQIHAEFDFPLSGLDRLEDCVPLPLARDSEADPSRKEYQFFLLAQIAIRRLLNRVHLSLYSQGQADTNTGSADAVAPALASDSSTSPPYSIIHELDNQVQEWRACLPTCFQFPDLSLLGVQQLSKSYGLKPTREKLLGYLQARYYAARSIIYRPLLMQALHNKNVSLLSSEDKKHAQVALEAAILAACHSGLHTESPSLLLYPINPCRCVYAAALQVQFVLKDREVGTFALPDGWEVIYELQGRIAAKCAPLSPIVARDLEILRAIESEL